MSKSTNSNSRNLLLTSIGKTVGEIAEMVNLSVKTVSTYRLRLITKLQLKNNAEIIRYCIRNKIVKWVLINNLYCLAIIFFVSRKKR